MKLLSKNGIDSCLPCSLEEAKKYLEENYAILENNFLFS